MKAAIAAVAVAEPDQHAAEIVVHLGGGFRRLRRALHVVARGHIVAVAEIDDAQKVVRLGIAGVSGKNAAADLRGGVQPAGAIELERLIQRVLTHVLHQNGPEAVYHAILRIG